MRCFVCIVLVGLLRVAHAEPRDEMAEARFHAGQMTNERHIIGQVARALMSHRDGNGVEARRAIATILALQPQWKSNPRHEIGKLITGAAIADRLAHDLAEAGLRGAGIT